MKPETVLEHRCLTPASSHASRLNNQHHAGDRSNKHTNMTMMGAVDVPLGTFKGSDYNTTVELWGEGAMGFPAKPKPE